MRERDKTRGFARRGHDARRRGARQQRRIIRPVRVENKFSVVHTVPDKRIRRRSLAGFFVPRSVGFIDHVKFPMGVGGQYFWSGLNDERCGGNKGKSRRRKR